MRIRISAIVLSGLTALVSVACGVEEDDVDSGDLAASSGKCTIEKNGVEGDAKACLRSQGIRWTSDEPRPSTLEEILAGPPGDPQLGLESEIHCVFRPHAKSQKSPKFRCFRTDESGVFFTKDGALEPRAKAVGPEEGPLKDALLDASGAPIKDAAGENIEGDELKVKYFNGGTQSGNHFEGADLITNDRESEMFTETASARLFWALGLPSDRMFEISRAHCKGCGPDPFNQTRIEPTKDATFHTPAVEREKFPGKKITEVFSFNDATSAMSSWPAKARVEYEQLILGAQLIHYHNLMDQQNRVSCAKSAVDKATGVCSAPTFMIQDVGSTWGGDGLFTNPRGDYKKYSGGKAIKDTRTCELGINFAGINKISPAGWAEFKTRIEPLTRDKLRAIFVAARFDRMEPDRFTSLGADTVIDQWTDALAKRVNDLRKCAGLGPI